MVFLNPEFLWASLAVAIPILVHLFNFRKPKRMLFSNVAFVREVNRSVVRRMRLRQWLLLALRCLAILAMVFMFSGPVWVSDPDQENTRSARSVLVIIDNSPSMSAADKNGTFLYQAQVMAKEILQSGASQDEFLLIPTSDLNPGQPYQKPQETLARLDQIQAGHTSMDFGSLVQQVEGLTEKALMPEKVVYILSDFQRSQLNPMEGSKEDTSNIKIVCIPVGITSPANKYVQQIELTHPILERGKVTGITGIYYNDSSEPVEEAEVRLMIEGIPNGTTLISCPPGDTTRFTLNFTPDKSGWNSGFVEVSDGISAFDDKRYFSFFIPDSTRILVIEGEKTDNTYIHTVFNKVLRQFQFTYIPEHKSGDYDPVEYDAVILSGIKDLTGSNARKLAEWVNEGGSLMVLPHPEQQVSGMNTLLQSLNIGQFIARREEKEGIKLKAPDAAHPLFEGVFRQGKTARADAPVVYSWHPLQVNIASGAQPIISFPDGSPFLLEAKAGMGQALIMSCFPDSRQSDFPYKSIFLPVFYRSLLLLTHSSRTHLFTPLGDETPVLVKAKNADVLKLRSENKAEFIPEQYSRNGQTVMNFSRQFPAPGNYQIINNDIVFENISFNYPDSESELDYIRKDELLQRLTTYSPYYGRFQVLDTQLDSFRDDLALQDTGISLWKIFLYILLACLILEIALLFITEKKVQAPLNPLT